MLIKNLHASPLEINLLPSYQLRSFELTLSTFSRGNKGVHTYNDSKSLQIKRDFIPKVSSRATVDSLHQPTNGFMQNKQQTSYFDGPRWQRPEEALSQVCRLFNLPKAGHQTSFHIPGTRRRACQQHPASPTGR